VYFPEERHLLVSDIPNNRIMKHDGANNTFTVFRETANYANGNARDRHGRPSRGCVETTPPVRRMR
jgi:gluconolactonase